MVKGDVFLGTITMFESSNNGLEKKLKIDKGNSFYKKYPYFFVKSLTRPGAKLTKSFKVMVSVGWILS